MIHAIPHQRPPTDALESFVREGMFSYISLRRPSGYVLPSCPECPTPPEKQPCKCVDEVAHLIECLSNMEGYEMPQPEHLTPSTLMRRKPSLNEVEKEKKRKGKGKEREMHANRPPAPGDLLTVWTRCPSRSEVPTRLTAGKRNHFPRVASSML